MVNDPRHPIGAAAGITERVEDLASREEMVEFLRGNGSLNGRWFGEGPPARPFWWRRFLHVLTDPIPMVLHCPACGTQHIDQATEHWPNPPHRSHLCGACGCIWRPADVPTVGVEAVTTHSACDTWPLIKEMSERNDELAPPMRDEYGVRYVPYPPPNTGRYGVIPPITTSSQLPPNGVQPIRRHIPIQDEGDLLAGGLVERQAVLNALNDGHSAESVISVSRACAIVRGVPHAHG